MRTGRYTCYPGRDASNVTVKDQHYAGVLPWGDFGLSFSSRQPVTSEKVRYLGTAGHQKVADGSKQYYHGDLIDSVWLTTAGDATPAGFASYTAFGELLDESGSPGGNGPPPGPPADFGRYQYAGGWGYESPAGEGFPGAPGGLILAGVNPDLPPITLLHVGARWYDPSLGRFVQRDPMGIDGGLNVYAYCALEPTSLVDPVGEYWVKTGHWFPRWFINLTGGGGRLPVLDPGGWQTGVQVGADLVSLAAPTGAGWKIITATPKCLKAIRQGWAGKRLVWIRDFIRYDLPHHGKGPHWDGIIPRIIRGEPWY